MIVVCFNPAVIDGNTFEDEQIRSDSFSTSSSVGLADNEASPSKRDPQLEVSHDWIGLLSLRLAVCPLVCQSCHWPFPATPSKSVDQRWLHAKCTYPFCVLPRVKFAPNDVTQGSLGWLVLSHGVHQSWRDTFCSNFPFVKIVLLIFWSPYFVLGLICTFHFTLPCFVFILSLLYQLLFLWRNCVRGEIKKNSPTKPAT